MCFSDSIWLWLFYLCENSLSCQQFSYLAFPDSSIFNGMFFCFSPYSIHIWWLWSQYVFMIHPYLLAPSSRALSLQRKERRWKAAKSFMIKCAQLLFVWEKKICFSFILFAFFIFVCFFIFHWTLNHNHIFFLKDFTKKHGDYYRTRVRSLVMLVTN